MATTPPHQRGATHRRFIGGQNWNTHKSRECCIHGREVASNAQPTERTGGVGDEQELTAGSFRAGATSAAGSGWRRHCPMLGSLLRENEKC
jgi:hypothetical protein